MIQSKKESAQTAIVILNWNGWQDTIECLKSISHLASDDFTVVVVDNASTNDSRQKILAWKSPNLVFNGAVEQQDLQKTSFCLSSKTWIYVQSQDNGGFASGNNLGIKLALDSGCEYVWLLNNDTVVDTEALNALLNKMKTSPNIGMCGSVLRFFNDRNIIQAIGGVSFNFFTARGIQLGQGLSIYDPEISNVATHALTYISGASLFLSSDFLRDVGLMEESYFLYFEEIDWAMRAKSRWEIATAINSIVYHKEGASIGTSSRAKRSNLSQYYLNRNLIRFYALRKTWLLPFALLSVAKELVKLIFKNDWILAKITFNALIDGLEMRSGKKKYDPS